MTKRTRRGSVKLVRNMPNMSNNQYVMGGKIALRVTHYKDGHYCLSVNGMPARRINAEYARTLAGGAEELEITKKAEDIPEDICVHISRKNRNCKFETANLKMQMQKCKLQIEKCKFKNAKCKSKNQNPFIWWDFTTLAT